MKVVLSMGALLALVGCASAPPNSRDALIVSDIVEQTVATTRAPAAEQRRLLAQAERRLAEEPSEEATVRLGALLVLLPEPLGDDARAKAMLEAVAAREPRRPVAQFAALLSKQAAETQRLHRELELVRRNAHQREEALREQIEALKAIEREILEREEKLRAKRR